MGIDNKVLNSFLSICKYIVKYKRCQHIIFTDNLQPSCVGGILSKSLFHFENSISPVLLTESRALNLLCMAT